MIYISEQNTLDDLIYGGITMKNIVMHIDDSEHKIPECYKLLSYDVRQQLIKSMLKDIKESKGASCKIRSKLSDNLGIFNENNKFNNK